MVSKNGKYAVTYFIVAYGNESIGVAKKIEDQIAAWTAKKLEILLFVVTDTVGAEVWKKIDAKSKILVEKKGILRYFSRTLFLYLAKRETQEILYIRETFPIPYLRMKKGPRWILEVQTIQQNELKLRSIFRLKLYRFLQKSWNSKFEGVVFVSNELSQLLKNSYKKSQSIVISNGINLTRYSEKPLIRNENGLQFLFIGSLDQEWQGTDQLIELAAVMPNVKFNLIGPTISNLKAPENVVFHGLLNTEQYSAIASKCRLAFGTLNQQVTGMNEASPLKVREYLALGLPVVIRYIDTDFQADHHFILKIPIDSRRLVEYKKEIIEFSSRWADKRVSESEIAPFISVNGKEHDRLAFFDRILTEERR